jgi:magnesium transporter
MSHAPAIWDHLESLIQSQDGAGVAAFLDTLSAAEQELLANRLDEEDMIALLALVPANAAADFLENLPDEQAADILEELPPEAAAEILDEMESDDQADVLGALEAEDAEAILERMDPEEAEDARRLLAYEPDTAGGLMFTEYLAYPSSLTVGEVLDDLRSNREKYSDYRVMYIYTIDADGHLQGVVRIRDLLLSPPESLLAQYTCLSPVVLPATANIEYMDHLFDTHNYYALPVVDTEGRLVGAVRRRVLQEEMEEASERRFLSFSGILGGEEQRSMALSERTRRRLPWLSINIVLNMISASVITLFQPTLQQVLVLAVFLPIISDMSGCSGNQAVAVTIREIARGQVMAGELLRVLWKEFQIGLVNGVVLGGLIGVIAWGWQGNPWLGLVVGGALCCNCLFAVCVGGCVPLLLRRVGGDPALASSPILTTVTDMAGFLLVLGFATLALSHLVP